MINIPLCKKCKRPSSTGELCMDCQAKDIQNSTPHTHVKYISEEDIENMRIQRRLDKEMEIQKNAQQEQRTLIAVLFCHGPGIDAYYYLRKFDTHYIWSRHFSEHMHPISLDGYLQDVLDTHHVAPGWVGIKRRSINEVLFVRIEYKNKFLPYLYQYSHDIHSHIDEKIPLADSKK